MQEKEEITFREIKKEIRIVGIDDCPFTPKTHRDIFVFGIVTRGGYWIDGVMRTRVEVDGFDATEKIADMIKSSPHYKQLRVIMLDGITFAGFNLVDARALFKSTRLPVLAITREKININSVRSAIKHLSRWEERLLILQNNGEPVKLKIRETELNMHVVGISTKNAEKIVQISCTRGNIPEPLRLAHIIASGLTKQINQ